MLKENERKILKLLQTFGPLNQKQIVRYFESEMFGEVNGILRNLKRKNMVVYDRALFQYALPGWRKGNNAERIRAFYVFLEFKENAGNVTVSDSPGQICFTLDSNFYEIINIPIGQETYILRSITEHPDTKYICILDSLQQADSLGHAANILAVCTVRAGNVQFYIKDEPKED